MEEEDKIVGHEYQWGYSGGIEKKSLNLGRNDKCPCNSGKKYKKCCLGVKIYAAK